MDATPLTLGQELSGWAAQLAFCETQLARSLDGLYELALGGTAVGTGLNTHPKWAGMVAAKIAELSGAPVLGRLPWLDHLHAESEAHAGPHDLRGAQPGEPQQGQGPERSRPGR